jgi:hypothetical protein
MGDMQVAILLDAGRKPDDIEAAAAVALEPEVVSYTDALELRNREAP